MHGVETQLGFTPPGNTVVLQPWAISEAILIPQPPTQHTPSPAHNHPSTPRLSHIAAVICIHPLTFTVSPASVSSPLWAGLPLSLSLTWQAGLGARSPHSTTQAPPPAVSSYIKADNVHARAHWRKWQHDVNATETWDARRHICVPALDQTLRQRSLDSDNDLHYFCFVLFFFAPLLARSTPSGFSWLGHSILMHISLDSKRARIFILIRTVSNYSQQQWMFFDFLLASPHFPYMFFN